MIRPRRLTWMLSLGICVSAVSFAAQSSIGWQAKMKSLGQIMDQLLVDSSSEARFNDPKNRQRVDQNVKQLAELARGLTHGATAAGAPDNDPSVLLLSGLFSQEADRAQRELKRGNRAYARTIVRSVSGYCMACHTRGQAESKGPMLGRERTAAALQPLERAEYFAITRQFDRALTELEKVIEDPNAAKVRMLEWERAIRQAIVISVRVKNDPDKTLTLIEQVEKSPYAPYFLKEQAKRWKESAQAWSAEPKREARSEDGLHGEAVRLLAEARQFQKYPADRSADIYYLRASAVVHELMERYPQGVRLPDALLMAGIAYEALRDLGLWELHEHYYEACIRRVPHTESAMNCYRHYEETIHRQFSGSGGLFLPADVVERLTKLGDLAAPEKAGGKTGSDAKKL